MNDFIFDQVKIISGENAGTTFTPEEFLKIPVIKRVSFTVTKSAIFLLKGKEVDRVKALNQIRTKSAKK